MKKIKLHLLLLALLGIGAAWVNKPPKASKSSIHKYSFRMYSSDGTKLYYVYDLTSLGYQEGVNYDCYNSSYTCTFMGDPLLSHSDFTGTYFYIWNIPSSGINKSGMFVLY